MTYFSPVPYGATEMPLPRQGVAVAYDNPQSGEWLKVQARPDGTFYGHAAKFDFEAATAEELINKLRQWGFTVAAGWEVEK